MALLLATPLTTLRKVGGGNLFQVKYPQKVSFGGIMLFPYKKKFVGGMMLVPLEKKFVGLQVECKKPPSGGKGPYMCARCERRFMSEGGFENHWNEHHAEVVAKKFWCRKCTHYFINSERLKNHKCLTPIELALRDDARIRAEEEEKKKKREEDDKSKEEHKIKKAEKVAAAIAAAEKKRKNKAEKKKKKEEMAAAAIAAAEMKSLTPEEKAPPTVEETEKKNT